MKKYAVGMCNLLDNETKVAIVEAKNAIDAIIIAVEGNLLNAIKFKTINDVQQYYFDGDLSVSEPIEI